MSSPAPRPLRLARAGEKPEPVCPFGKCDGSGWLIDADDLATPCQCRERIMARKRTSGVSTSIPRRYQGVSFDRPPLSDMARDQRTAPVARAVRVFADEIDANLDEGKGLWLMGDVGTGKTSLAMAVSKAAVEAGRSVAIYSLPRLLARIRRTYDSADGEDSYLEFFDRLASVDLLHIDDLGAEKRSDWVLEQLYAIVDERYQSQRSVVVTTNLDQPELEEQIGPRTVSRLVEICGDPLPLNGEDLRYRVRPV